MPLVVGADDAKMADTSSPESLEETRTEVATAGAVSYTHLTLPTNREV